MLATYGSAGFFALGALVLGQAVLRLCGTDRWSWLSGPVGIAAMMLIAVPSLHVPGRSTTVAVLLFLLVLGAAGWLFSSPAHRPPVHGLLAILPVALLTALPFVAAGHAGTLGWSFNNDMASHLLWADAYRTDLVERFNPLEPDYPYGPHALVAVVAQGFGIGVDAAFAGLTIAATLLLGWTGLAALRQPRWWAPAPTVLLVGMPFLVAGYYGQGSFKELLQALLVLGVAVLLAFPPVLGERRRSIPTAVLLAGTLSVYSFLGLAWPLAFLGLWFAGVSLTRMAAKGSVRAVLPEARAGLLPALVGAGVLLLVIVPQLPRLKKFIEINTGTNGTGIAKDDIGNLVGRMPIWEAFGTWGSGDYRVPGPDQFATGMWVAFVLVLVLLAAAWALRRGEWMLVAATAMTILIWAVSDRVQSPYVAAKALVILSPMLMLVAVRVLAEHDRPGHAMPSWWWLAAPAAALLLVVRVGDSSWKALHQSPVGPSAHTDELRALQPLLQQRPTLYLGNDDFTRWELGQTPVKAPIMGYPVLPFRAEKPWSYGMNYDLDSLDSATLNQFDWVISPRDAAASAPPAQLRPVRRTRNFVLYRRTAPIPQRSILAEGDGASGPLDCGTLAGRTIVQAGGVAAIRAAPVVVAAPPLSPGQSVTLPLPLPPGTWDLVSTYYGPRAVRVNAPGLSTTLVPHFDRPGPRWPIGRVTVTGAAPLPLSLSTTKDRWTADTAVNTLNAVIAIPVGSALTVPIRQACGKLVDWYSGR